MALSPPATSGEECFDQPRRMSQCRNGKTIPQSLAKLSPKVILSLHSKSATAKGPSDSYPAFGFALFLENSSNNQPK